MTTQQEENLRFVMASAISYKMMHDKLTEFAAKQTEEEQQEAEAFYTHFGYTLSLEIMDKINLGKEIGEAHLQKLHEILEHENGYNIFTLLVNHEPESEDVRFHTTHTIQATIDKKHALVTIHKQSVHQRIEVLDELRQHFYPGDILFTFKSDMNPQEAVELVQRLITHPHIYDLEKGEFYPKFRQEIQEIIGKDNFLFDTWEFGGYETSLFWYIRKEVYQDVMKKITDWLKYLEITHLVKFKIENI